MGTLFANSVKFRAKMFRAHLLQLNVQQKPPVPYSSKGGCGYARLIANYVIGQPQFTLHKEMLNGLKSGDILNLYIKWMIFAVVPLFLSLKIHYCD